jgi:hypothetical protein
MNGSDVEQLTNDLWTNRKATLSHDGSKVALVSNSNNYDDRCAMNID